MACRKVPMSVRRSVHLTVLFPFWAVPAPGRTRCASRASAAHPLRLADNDVQGGLALEGQHRHEPGGGARLPLEDEAAGLEVLAARLALCVLAPLGQPLAGVHLGAARVQEAHDLLLAEAHAVDRVRHDLA